MLLCWHVGEEGVTAWHGLDEGFAAAENDRLGRRVRGMSEFWRRALVAGLMIGLAALVAQLVDVRIAGAP